MHGAETLIQALAIVLGTAAVVAVLSHKLRQPVVLGYLLAGVLVGPHTPVPLVADGDTVRVLSELGVILLMFSLGLEFSLKRLWQVGPTAGVTAVIQCSLMIWFGLLIGRGFGWTSLESLFLGAIIAISSTTIIAKVFEEQKIGGHLRELVVGVLVVEDLIAILLMAMLTAVATGSGLSPSALAATVGKLSAFLAGLVVLGLLVIPRVVRWVYHLGRPEFTTIATVAICFAISLLAHAFGYSVALGAFLAGSLVAESGHAHEIEHQVRPVRDVFAAVFFVSVGMMLDPDVLVEHWPAVVVVTAVVIVGKFIGVGLGSFLTGNGVRTSVQAGLSLAQIGEFSFIIAALGVSLNAIGPFLYPIAIACSAVTTLTTPFLIRAAGPVASFVDRKLPARVQTFAALYGSWLEGLARTHRDLVSRRTTGRLIRLVLIDAALFAAVVIGASIAGPRVETFLAERTGIPPELTRWVVMAGAAILALPFVIGIVRVTGRLGHQLAQSALPQERRVDLAHAPRRLLTTTLQIAIVLAVGAPLLAITQPFVGAGWGAPLLLAVLAVLGVGFWRGARELEGHVRAGAQVIAEALAPTPHAEHVEPVALPPILPGIGEPVSVVIPEGSTATGRSLAELQLRALTGATVLAIRRGEEHVAVPSAREVIRAGDIVALAGSRVAVDAAKALLTRVDVQLPELRRDDSPSAAG